MAILYALSSGAIAGTYKWVDANGRVHYGDTLPRDSAGAPLHAEKVELVVPRFEREPRPSASVIDAWKKLEREIVEQRAKSAAARAEEDERLARERRCLEARKKLAVLATLHLPVYRTHAGTFRALWRHDLYEDERSYLEPDERASETARAREGVTKWCRDPDGQAAQALVRARWIASEYCAAARAELQAAEEPPERRSNYAIESLLDRVEEECAVPERGEDIVDSLPVRALPLWLRKILNK